MERRAALHLCALFLLTCLAVSRVNSTRFEYYQGLYLRELQKDWGTYFTDWVVGGECSNASFVACDAQGMITSMYLGLRNLKGSIPPTIGSLTKLAELDLSENMLSGPIPSTIVSLSTLSHLDLHSNQLTGSIPSTIGSLSELTYLNLEGNNFDGPIPPAIGNLGNLLTLYADGPCPPDYDSCMVTQDTSSAFCQKCSSFCDKCDKLTPGAIAGIVVAVMLFLVVVVAVLVWRRGCCHKAEATYKENKDAVPAKGSQERRGGREDPESLAAAMATAAAGGRNDDVAVEMEAARPHVCQEYSLEELAKATADWAEENRIGSGSFGDVYKGVSPHSCTQVWAVKRARVLTNDFLTEVKEMASKHHPHLVRLLGYCMDMNTTTRHIEQILIYEYMENNDLESWIGPSDSNILSLRQRLDVLIGVAKGLQYLHDFGIVHRDIKPANILLDGKMQAKIADFGLVKLSGGTSMGTSVAATRVMGTPGYVDPAYYKTHKATPAADVHSFGVVMLVVITARKAVHVTEDSQISLKQWVAPLVASSTWRHSRTLTWMHQMTWCCALLALPSPALPCPLPPALHGSSGWAICWR
ncbi:hypothetical protein CLOM_g1759 [Closterium sp. NIES-68]|nr:hypothetical protein CLOM_g1759 [Closterium sp. NIES-68]